MWKEKKGRIGVKQSMGWRAVLLGGVGGGGWGRHKWRVILLSPFVSSLISNWGEGCIGALLPFFGGNKTFFFFLFLPPSFLDYPRGEEDKLPKKK